MNYKYNINNLKEEYNIVLRRPKDLSENLDFSPEDIDTENNLIAFRAYYPSYRFSFQKSLKPQVWVYDIEKEKYILRRVLNRKESLIRYRKGGVYIFFIPDSLCKQITQSSPATTQAKSD